MSRFCELKEVHEGKALIRHCDLSRLADERGYVDPAWAPVFYNPRMRCSRDLSTAVVAAYAGIVGRGDLLAVDVMCGTGVRGIRYALEVSGVSRVIVNDVDARAFEVAKENISLNSLGDVVVADNKEAHSLLSAVKADIVDVDPFGTPAPYVHPALRAVKHGGLLCVTATDLPALMGIYPSACVRKYFSLSFKSEFSRELAIRILLYFIAREAAKLGKSVRPFYSYSVDHHARVCVVVENAERSGFLEGMTGFVVYNPSTLERRTLRLVDVAQLPWRQAIKEGEVWGGPLWLGELWDCMAAEAVYSEYARRVESYGYCKRGLKVAERVRLECGKPSLYYTTEALASAYKLQREVPPRVIVGLLSEKGYSSSLTHFDTKGFRTNARVREILDLWVRSSR